MTVDQAQISRRHDLPQGGALPGERTATRQRILEIALTLMSQRGVDGTSMRDLAAAAGLNVASLYHYFPSKRDLLEAVLVEEGVHPIESPLTEAGMPEPGSLADLLTLILGTIFDVEDFVRLMVTEAMRGEATARAVGLDLFASFEASIAEWLSDNRPDLDDRPDAGAVARLLSAMVVGIFIQHAAGVLGDADLTALARTRAGEAADVLRPPG